MIRCILHSKYLQTVQFLHGVSGDHLGSKFWGNFQYHRTGPHVVDRCVHVCKVIKNQLHRKR